MKKEKVIEKTVILTIISSSAGLPAAYLREKGANYQPPNNTLALLQVGCMTEALTLLDAEIRLAVERWTFALDYVSAVINDRFLLFRGGPPLESLSSESLSSESLCAISTTPNQE
ncbi:hypothetical protein AYI68_g860 [Smittium mucronatum]|uniref:Uncharacterized protein n=1 Tax=Smittium mucronatum TaxID=133383 RepID=A0A1R0H765_9FUNG|nr:hypothetical protein AYI68_g860 [Smittium mucronatum]